MSMESESAEFAASSILAVAQSPIDSSVRVSPPLLSLPASDPVPVYYSLLAVSNTFGFAVFGTSSGFGFARTGNIQSLLENASPRTCIDLADKHVFDVGDDVVNQIRLSATNDRVFIAFTSGKIAVYNASNLAVGDATPWKIFPSPTDEDVLLLPNPEAYPEYCALNCSDGSLFLLNVESGEMKELEAVSNTNAICWSRRGKQLAVGDAEGVVRQVSVDGKPKNLIKPPPSLLGQQISVESILWIEDKSFIVIYFVEGEDQAAFVITQTGTAKSGLKTSYLKVQDPCPFVNLERDMHYYYGLISSLGDASYVIPYANFSSMDIGFLGCKNGEWSTWTLADNISLPLDAENNDTYPLGLDIDFTNTKPISLGGSKFCPAPLLYILNSDGCLILYNIVDLNSGDREKACPAMGPAAELPLPPGSNRPKSPTYAELVKSPSVSNAAAKSPTKTIPIASISSPAFQSSKLTPSSHSQSPAKTSGAAGTVSQPDLELKARTSPKPVVSPPKLSAVANAVGSSAKVPNIGFPTGKGVLAEKKVAAVVNEDVYVDRKENAGDSEVKPKSADKAKSIGSVVEEVGGEIDAEFLDIRQPAIDVKLVVSEPFEHPIEESISYNLLAISNKFGFVVFGTHSGFGFVKTNEIHGILAKAKPRQWAEVDSKFTVEIEDDLVNQIRLSANQENIYVGCTSGWIFTYKAADLTSRVSAPNAKFRCPGDESFIMLPNPEAYPEICAIQCLDGPLYLLNTQTKEFKNIENVHDVFGITWSRKGKQLAVGDSNGAVRQISLEGVIKNTIPCPPNQKLSVQHICWLEDKTFIVTYVVDEGVYTTYVVTQSGTSKTGINTTFVRLEDPCPYQILERKGWYYCGLISDMGKHSNILVYGNFATSEVGVIGLLEGKWTKLRIGESFILPMDKNDDDTFTVGLGIDFTSTVAVKPVSVGGTDLCPSPLLYILTSAGCLLVYNVVDSSITDKTVACADMKVPEPIPGAAEMKTPIKHETKLPGTGKEFSFTAETPNATGIPIPSSSASFSATGSVFGTPASLPVVASSLQSTTIRPTSVFDVKPVTAQATPAVGATVPASKPTTASAMSAFGTTSAFGTVSAFSIASPSSQATPFSFTAADSKSALANPSSTTSPPVSGLKSDVPTKPVTPLSFSNPIASTLGFSFTGAQNVTTASSEAASSLSFSNATGTATGFSFTSVKSGTPQPVAAPPATTPAFSFQAGIANEKTSNSTTSPSFTTLSSSKPNQSTTDSTISFSFGSKDSSSVSVPTKQQSQQIIESKWICSVCLVQNESSVQKCVACETARGAPTTQPKSLFSIAPASASIPAKVESGPGNSKESDMKQGAANNISSSGNPPSVSKGSPLSFGNTVLAAPLSALSLPKQTDSDADSGNNSSKNTSTTNSIKASAHSSASTPSAFKFDSTSADVKKEGVDAPTLAPKPSFVAVETPPKRNPTSKNFAEPKNYSEWYDRVCLEVQEDFKELKGFSEENSGFIDKALKNTSKILEETHIRISGLKKSVEQVESDFKELTDEKSDLENSLELLKIKHENCAKLIGDLKSGFRENNENAELGPEFSYLQDELRRKIKHLESSLSEAKASLLNIKRQLEIKSGSAPPVKHPNWDTICRSIRRITAHTVTISKNLDIMLREIHVQRQQRSPKAKKLGSVNTTKNKFAADFEDNESIPETFKPKRLSETARKQQEFLSSLKETVQSLRDFKFEVLNIHTIKESPYNDEIAKLADPPKIAKDTKRKPNQSMQKAGTSLPKSTMPSFPKSDPKESKGASQSWTCETCLVSNKIAVSVCIACETDRSAVSAKSKSLLETAESKTVTDKLSGGFGLNKPKEETKLNAESAGWTCSTCLVPNKSETNVCVACETKRDGESPAKPSLFNTTAAPNSTKDVSGNGFSFKASDHSVSPSGGFQLPPLTKSDMSVSQSTELKACQPFSFSTNAAPKPGGFTFTPAKPSPLSSDAKVESNVSKISSSKWTCDSCLVVNEMAAAVCIACETPKGGAKAPEKNLFAASSQSSHPSKASGSILTSASESSPFKLRSSSAIPDSTKPTEASPSQPATGFSFIKTSTSSNETNVPTVSGAAGSIFSSSSSLAPAFKVASDGPLITSTTALMPEKITTLAGDAAAVSSNPLASGFGASLSFGGDTSTSKNKVNPMFATATTPTAPSSAFGTPLGASANAGGLSAANTTPNDQSGKSASVFGSTNSAATASASVFSQNLGGSSGASPFGSKPTSSQTLSQSTNMPAFGQSSFGQSLNPPAFSQTMQSGSVFGQSTSTASGPVFGQNASPSSFGQTSAFGQTAIEQKASVFGSQPGVSQSVFGQSSFGSPGAQPAFGQQLVSTNPPASTTQSAFGQSGFGQPSFGQSAFGQSTFGQPAFGQSSFGQPAFGQSGFAAQVQTTAPSFPSVSLSSNQSVFGQSTGGGSTTFGGFAAGTSNANASAFGSTSGSTFGTSGFGTPSNAQSVFGASTDTKKASFTQFR